MLPCSFNFFALLEGGQVVDTQVENGRGERVFHEEASCALRIGISNCGLRVLIWLYLGVPVDGVI